MTKHTPPLRLLRNSRALRRAEEIVDAAAQVFAERGYHGTSTQAIADVLGLRQASLYYYFPSKEAALEIVCERGVDGFLERAEAIVARKESALQRLTHLVASHLEPIGSKPDYVRVFINERRYLPNAARKRIARKIRGVERCFADVLAAGVADGTLRPDIDIRRTVLLILGMCNAVINWPAADRDAIDETAREIALLATRGLRSGSGA
ncbi:MAG: TetR/AcrR family transcriptional regulator [Hyphomicrobiaceae bacterium]|nr:MAG: TetR/AcrR family transcriptional regulator [Hyphomicrobiaceae bacterium]